MLGRDYFTAVAPIGHVPALTAGVIDLTPSLSFKKSELISALAIAPVAGTAGKVDITFAGTYAVGDRVLITITSNSDAQNILKFWHTVQSGATAVADIAAAVAAQIQAKAGLGQVFASATSALGVVTATQNGDDKRSIVAYVWTDSAAGTIAQAVTQTVYSEGQPDDLRDKGVAEELIDRATFDTVRIELQAEAAIPFIDSVGATAREIYLYVDATTGAAIATLINT